MGPNQTDKLLHSKENQKKNGKEPMGWEKTVATMQPTRA